MSGTAASSARVYGCRARVRSSAAGRSSTMRPAYMTSTRSQTSATTVMSWLISNSATPSAARMPASSSQHLLLHRHVQRGGGLVGDDQRGRAHQAHADHRALAHAAGELVRVLARAPLRGAGSGPPAAGPPPAPSPARASCPGAAGATSASWRPIRWVGLKEVIGSWNTIASEVPSSWRCVRRRPSQQVLAEELAAARRPTRARLARSAAATARAVSDLPDPDSPTTPTASPRRDREADAAHRARPGPPRPGS